MSLPQFTLLRPHTLQEALGTLARHASNIRVLAGGTDLIPSMRQKLFEPEYVLDIRHLAELKSIHRQPGEGVSIGALSTLTSVEHSEFLRKHYPVLSEAAATVASPVLRNMGTIGGNICLDTRCLWYNQSLTWRKGCGFCIKKDGDLCHVAPGGTKCWAAFSGDTPAALLCLNAEIELASESGAESFFPRSDKELSEAVEKITKDLRTQYTLGFYPSSDDDNHYHQLRVAVRGGRYKVRARPGYSTSVSN